ncbi:MAG: PilZ domain-containing protein [Chloroflexi bacterium]|nr:PilZ domain-containing protein [Chloroflexota bacterium]
MNESTQNEINLNEQREAPRANAAFQIAYEFFNPRGAKVEEGIALTVNISGRGALIEMPHGLDLDGSLIMWITAPLYTMLFKGSVVHSRLAQNGLFHIGVKLTDIIEGRWEMLEQTVQELLVEPG